MARKSSTQQLIERVASRFGDEASKYTTLQIASLREDLLSFAKLVEAQYRVVSALSNQRDAACDLLIDTRKKLNATRKR
jgi:hypothetical protein